MDQQGLADLLNECEYLYGYDQLSAMYECARLCGCKVKYFGGMEYEDLEKYEPGLDGIGFNNDDVGFDPYHFSDHYHSLIETFEKRLELFIEDTQ